MLQWCKIAVHITLQYFSSYVASIDDWESEKTLRGINKVILLRQKGIRCFRVSLIIVPGSSLYLEKVSWSRLVTCLACQPKPHGGWVLNLILLTLSVEVNVALLYRRYFETEASYLSVICQVYIFVKFVVDFFAVREEINRQTVDGANSIKSKTTFVGKIRRNSL